MLLLLILLATTLLAREPPPAGSGPPEIKDQLTEPDEAHIQPHGKGLWPG